MEYPSYYAGITSNRFQKDSAFEQGFEAGGPLLGQAAMVLGRYGCSVSKASYDPSIEIDTAEEQEEVLQKWAGENGCWYSYPKKYYSDQGFKFYGFGGEASVYTEGDDYVHKVCRIGQYDSLVHFFDRIVIQNAICPEAKLVVEGFGRDADEFAVMFKQKFFRQENELMSLDEISSYMENLGFWKDDSAPYGFGVYYSDSVIAEDIHQRNIWKTSNSNVVIVDGVFRFNTPWLRKNGKYVFGW